MFKWASLLGLLGLFAATAVIVWSGWDMVLQALAKAGWGIVLVALFHFVPIAVSSAGWRMISVGRRRPSYPMFFYFMWIRSSVNNMMPVARIGGEIASIRIMAAHGMRKTSAIAITVAELTLSIAAIFLFVGIGVLLFAVRVSDKNAVLQMALGLALSAPLLAAMIGVQKIGFFGLLSRLFKTVLRDKWSAFAGSAARLDRAVAAVYRRKGQAWACALMQLAAWTLGSVEIWLALQFLGHPLPILESIMIEALIQGSASVAFAVPGALGVQEAGFLVFGGMLGLSHETSAALAVIRRCRDLLCYVPGLVAWQMHEGKRLLRK